MHLEKHGTAIPEGAGKAVAQFPGVDMPDAVKHGDTVGKYRAMHMNRKYRLPCDREGHRIRWVRVHNRHHVGPRSINPGVNLSFVRLTIADRTAERPFAGH